jgi:hypothetical protein
VPYVKDLLSYGCNLAEDEEIVVFTNSDIICRSDCSAMIAAQLQDSHAIYSHRRDFGRLDLIPDDSNFSLGSEYAGTDLFAFRAYWWKAYCDSFPDLLLSFEGWDACLCHLIVWTNPGGKTVLKDITCHERHASRWENPANRKTLPGQVHNIQNASAWLLKHGINPAIHGITYA